LYPYTTQMAVTLLVPGLIKLPKGFHALQVSSVKRLTTDAVQITLHIPESLRENYQFKPGQHIDLLLAENGSQLRRSYSICSDPGEPLSIGVKALPEGKVSRFLNTETKSGDVLIVSEPRGSFNLNKDASKLMLIGAGSGITPLFSMLKSAIQDSIPVTLLFGNRNSSSIMFKNELAELASAKIIHFLSGEQKEGYEFGRIDRNAIFNLHEHDPSLLMADAYYLCGPEAMVTEVRELLLTLGISKEMIHTELFTAPTAPPDEEIKAPNAFSGKSNIHVKLEGDNYEFEVDANSPELLTAALKAGLDAPYSCRTGICGSCRAKILKGEAIMKANYALTEEELGNGYILTCQALPACNELTISYDD